MARLDERTIIWLATTRPDGRPHLTPIWFAWHDGKVWVCTNTTAVKARNVARDPRVAVSLEDGGDPLVGEGTVTLHERPYPPGAVAAFVERFDWDISRPDDDGPYDSLWEITVDRWILGSPDR